MSAPLMDGVRAWFADYVSTVTPGDLDLLALWTVHTHLVQETYTTPRLLFDSPVPGSGKTTALEHLQRLCHKPLLMSTISSSAMLARILDAGPRTLLIDEADRSLRPDNPGTPDVLAVLNSGYKRGSTRPVLVPVKGGAWEVAEMPTFAPVAIAGNDPKLPDDTRSRIIRVLLMPDTGGSIRESDWEVIEPEAARLAAKIAGWADEHRAFVLEVRPQLPDGVVGRYREKWSPLARVAAAAGGRWPSAVDAMATEDVEQVQADREDGLLVQRPHVLILQHLAEVWPVGRAFVPTAELIELLIVEHPEAWSSRSTFGHDLTAQRLGRFLAGHYKVNSSHSPDKSVRGYKHPALATAWGRMGIAPPPLLSEPSKASEASEPSGVQGDGSDGSDGPDGLPQAPRGNRPASHCSVCHRPLVDVDRTGTHPNCSPEAVTR